MFQGVLIFFFFVIMLIVGFNYKKRRNVLYLIGLYLAAFIYAISHFSISTLQDPFWSAIFINHFTPLYLLAGPFLFFYVRNTLLGAFVWKRTDVFHFIPGFIQCIAILPYSFKSFDNKKAIMQSIIDNTVYMYEVPFNMFFGTHTNFTIRLVSLLIYIFLSFRLWYIFKKNQDIKKYQISLKWLLSLIASVFLLVVVYAAFVLNLFSSPNDLYSATNTVILSTVAFAFALVGLIPIMFPHVLYGFSVAQKEREKLGNALGEVLPNAYYSKMAQRIEDLFNEKQPYLERSYKMAVLAEELKAPKHHVHQCFKTVYNTTFTAFKNKFRVQWVKQALNHHDFRNDTIDGIGSAAGFNSKSHFYTIFKRETGYSPKEYRKEVLRTNNPK